MTLDIVIGGTALFMAVAMLLGYLPYTDRPGPGWYGPRNTVGELPVVAAWLKLNFWVPPIYGAAIFVLVKPLTLFHRLPRAVVRVVASLLAAASGVLWVAATGWFFSLALVVQWAALVMGVLFGALLLPRILFGGRPAAA